MMWLADFCPFARSQLTEKSIELHIDDLTLPFIDHNVFVDFS